MDTPRVGGATGIRRQDIFNFMRANKLMSNPTNPQVLEKLLNYVKIKIGKENVEEKKSLIHLKQFACNLLFRWKKCSQNYNKFLIKYSSWLQKELITFSNDFHRSKHIGRPEKLFVESNIKTKKRKVESLAQSKSPDELALAAEIGYRSAGKRNVAKLIREVTNRSPESLKKVRTLVEQPNSEPTTKPYTPEEALALMVALKLTKHQYIELQKGANERNANLYPPYYLVLKSKTECYPSSLSIAENAVEIQVQDLLDHTSQRLVKLQDEVIVHAISGATAAPCFLQLECKWGLDGSGGHSMYKQNFSNANNNLHDSDILLTSLVPLQLNYQDDTKKKLVLWQNPRSSSTRFCRPLHLQFAKETAEMTRAEVSHIEGQIATLTPTKIILSSGIEVFVKYSLHKTMVDGKVCNSLMKNTSSQACYICGACPKDMNILEKVTKRPVKQSAFDFGLSTLHAHIRFFECILHLAYRLEIKKWQVRGTLEEKAAFELRKKTIIDRFKSDLGILVDVVKQGYGSTNDGNTARRFFENCEKSSEITGVDPELIHRFSVVLQALSSGYHINVESFRNYALDTARRFVSLYPWFYMPASIHKILIHGADVITNMILPIGQLSEDVQEARHKEYRHYREHNTRKISRVKTNEDLLHMFLISSDPIISSIRKMPTKKLNSLSTDVLGLLRNPEIDFPLPGHQ